MGIFDIFKKNKIEKVVASGKKTQPVSERDERVANMQQFETEYLTKNKNTMYDFFGYLIEPNETPFFVESSTKKIEGEFEFSHSVTPATPKMLKHCVTHLEPDALKIEQANLNGFITKCNQIASQHDLVPRASWDAVIAELTKFVQMPHHLSEEQLRTLVSNLTLSQLNLIDWQAFSKELKQNKFLPPSYNSNPADVKIWMGKDDVPRTLLKYVSTTSPNYRELIIRKGDVVVYVNGLSEGSPDTKISKYWKDYCGKTFGAPEHTEKQNQK